MLKFPIGWAEALVGLIGNKTSSSRVPLPINRLVNCMIGPHLSGARYFIEGISGLLSIEDVKVRIDTQCTAEIVLCGHVIADGMFNRAGVKKKYGVVRVQTQSLFYGLLGFGKLVIPVERPCQNIPGIDVVPNCELSARELHGLRKL